MSLLVVCCVEQFVFTCAALHVGLTAGRVMDYSPVRYVTNREVIPLLVFGRNETKSALPVQCLR